MNVTSGRQVILTLDDREAKLLGALIGSISPKDADDLIRRSYRFSKWLGELALKEVTDFTTDLYEGLYNQIEGER